MGKLALIGVGLWMIGWGADSPQSAGGILKILGGLLFIIAAFGVNF